MVFKVHSERSRDGRRDRIAAVTFFFDYVGFPQLRENYERFVARWRESGIPWFTVECVLRGQKPQLEGQNVSTVEVADPFIHKESAINYAVRRLPPEFQTVIWTDADMMFDDFAPMFELPERLTRARAVQVMRTLHYLNPNGAREKTKTAHAINPTNGFQGGAWAASREFFERFGGLYSGSPVGGHDTVFLIGVYDLVRAWRWHLRRRAAPQAAEIVDWVRRVHPYFDARVDCLPIEAEHLFHGPLTYREYGDKHGLVQHLPSSAYRRDANGFLEFAAPHEGERQALLDYWHRRESA